MATLAALLKLNKGTTAARTALTGVLEGEPFFDTTTASLLVYSGGVWVNTAATGSTETNAYQSGTDGAGALITSTATTTITLATTDLTKTVNLVATSGAGVFTHTVVLATTSAAAGDRATIMLALPASANPTVQFRTTTSGGTMLATVTGDPTAAQYWTGNFVFNGTAWLLIQSSYQSP